MHILDLDRLARPVTEWATTGVRVEPLALVGPSERTAVTLARFTPGANLGPHPAGYWQVFAVVEGSGWVSGNDQQRRPIDAGRAAVWEPGEVHESGSDVGMTVCIVQSATDPTAGLEQAE